MTPIIVKSGNCLALCCITATPELGSTTTGLILAASIPLTAILFWVAVQDTRANQQ